MLLVLMLAAEPHSVPPAAFVPATPAVQAAPTLSPFSGLEVSPTILQGDGDEQTLGLKYTYARSLAKFGLASGRSTDFDLQLSSSGTIAVERDLNPENLIDAALAVKYAVIQSGVKKKSKPAPTGAASGDALDNIDADDGFTLTANLHAGFEADQSLQDRHFVYGLGAYFKYQFPGDSTLWWNVFDYPATALRWLTGYEPDDQRSSGPMGLDALPSLGFSFDRVNPNGDDPRNLAGDDSEFTRAGLRLAMSSPVFDLGDGDANEVSLTAAFRYYSELSPSGTVEAADLDEFSFFSVSLKSQSGFFVTYTDGQLPFDVEDSQSYQMGWSHSF